MVPSGSLLLGNPPTSAVRDGDVYESRVLIPLFLAAAFLFFIAYQLFGVAAAAGVMVLFVALALASHRVRVSRDFPFLHVSRGAAGAGNSSGGGGGGGFRDEAGMDAAAIAALPAAFGYKREESAAATTGWAQCAICLGLVRVGEAVRLLPACGHLFHAGCIEKWLRAHATCPLCRAAVSGAAAAVPELPA